MSEIRRNEVEKFFCPVCHVRIDLCSCREYLDQGCWDCGPNCKINNRRKAKEELQKYLDQLNFVPKLRPERMIAESERLSSCCGVRLNRVMKNRVVSGILEVEHDFDFCSKCKPMYYFK